MAAAREKNRELAQRPSRATGGPISSRAAKALLSRAHEAAGLSSDSSHCAETSAAFAELRERGEDLFARGHLAACELSMGMSGDYDLAIAAGATQVRLGTAILGPRPRRET